MYTLRPVMDEVLREEMVKEDNKMGGNIPGGNFPKGSLMGGNFFLGGGEENFLEPFKTYEYTRWRYRQCYKMQNFLLLLNKVMVTLQFQKFRYGYSRQDGRVEPVELFKRNAV